MKDVYGWKGTILEGAEGGALPADYRDRDGVLGRASLLDAGGDRQFSRSEFVGRAQVPHTTSAVEAEIRRRHLARLVEERGIDRSKPALELGCADGLVTRHLLELGFEKLVSTDILYPPVAELSRSLPATDADRVLLVVDDLLRLPLGDSRFDTVIAWGVLSVSGDFDRALEQSWKWVAPGGYLLLAEPILESVLVYTLVRGDLKEFRRTLREGTRAVDWARRDERYGVNRKAFYDERLSELPGAEISDRGGVSLLPSLVLGGLVQDSPVPEPELDDLSDLLADPSLDDLGLWRQAFWLVQKR
jgi:SAM-dependent methyltransferase